MVQPRASSRYNLKIPTLGGWFPASELRPHMLRSGFHRTHRCRTWKWGERKWVSVYKIRGELSYSEKDVVDRKFTNQKRDSSLLMQANTYRWMVRELIVSGMPRLCARVQILSISTRFAIACWSLSPELMETYIKYACTGMVDGIVLWKGVTTCWASILSPIWARTYSTRPTLAVRLALRWWLRPLSWSLLGASHIESFSILDPPSLRK